MVFTNYIIVHRAYQHFIVLVWACWPTMVCRESTFCTINMILFTNILPKLCEKQITQTMPVRVVKPPIRTAAFHNCFSLPNFMKRVSLTLWSSSAYLLVAMASKTSRQWSLSSPSLYLNFFCQNIYALS